jgi:hypothetical protein
MPPAVIFLESDLEAFHTPTYDWPSPGENWDEELVVPGRMVHVGQGQMMFLRINEVDPGMVWPKRKAKKKKSAPQLPPSPAPAPEPAPIDWGDWEELCQAAPPQPPEPEDVWQPEDWDAELASQSEPPWEPEDWDAEIAASQWESEDPWQPEDWEAELSQWEPEDWDAELASQWQPEDWDAELASQ